MRKNFFPTRGLISTEDRGPTTHLLRFRGLDFKGFLKLHVSHLRGSVRPLGGPQSHFSPFPLVPVPSLIPNPPFSLPIHAQASAGTKMEDAARGRIWGLGGCSPLVAHPCPPPPSLAPTWAYPCRLLRLPILAASAPPRHLDPQTCGGPGWGSGDHCSRALGAPPAAVPAPALTTIFDTKKDGAGRGGGPRSRCFRRVVALGRPAPGPSTAPPPERPTVFCGHTRGRGRAWWLRSLHCFAPGQPDAPAPRAPRAGPAVRTSPGEHLGILYLLLLPLRLRLRLLGPPLARTPSGTPRADTEKGASDDRV